MADGPRALERFKVLRIEDLGDKAHSFMEAEYFSVAVARGDTSAFLTAMLKGKESVVG
jgi:hypothetical protein